MSDLSAVQRAGDEYQIALADAATRERELIEAMAAARDAGFLSRQVAEAAGIPTRRVTAMLKWARA